MKARGGGPALLFERPTLKSGAPARYPVAVNLFGSEKRMALALGVECLDEVGERIATLLNMKVPDSLSSVAIDRKSTRLNSSHGYISYAVFCLKKKKKKKYK